MQTCKHHDLQSIFGCGDGPGKRGQGWDYASGSVKIDDTMQNDTNELVAKFHILVGSCIVHQQVHLVIQASKLLVSLVCI